MEKLIELLNQFENTDNWENGHQVEFRESKIISKKFGFIKWLVDNDKIDFDNRDLKDEFMLEFERYPVFQGNTYNWDFNENGMLMLLAIQDDPISFLISMLKQDEENSTRN